MAGSRTLKLSILADVDDLKKKLSTADNDVQGFAGQVEKFGKIAAAAFAAAAAAAAAYAVKIGIDGVKAAIEDEAAQKRLAISLESATGATNDQIKAVEEQILKYQLAYGVSDKDLRPALQRLALSTNDLTKAQDLLSTALDVSAATGKPLESVTNAIAKAYDGSNTALARLGVGLSAAELKSMSFQQVQQRLNETFGGAAQAQAQTYQGQIARLTQTFEEAKESIGVALLPIIQKLLDFIINTAIPQFDRFKKAAIDPVIKAISDNKEEFIGLYNFIANTLAPFLFDVFFAKFKFLGNVVAFIIDAVAAGIKALQPILDASINGINAIIRGINLIKPGQDIAYVPKVSFSTSSLPTTSASQFVLPSTPKITTPSVSTPTVSPSVTSSASASAIAAAASASNVNVPMGAVGRGEYAGDTYINITGAIDPEATARQIIDVLNSSVARGGAGSNTALMA